MYTGGHVWLILIHIWEKHRSAIPARTGVIGVSRGCGHNKLQRLRYTQESTLRKRTDRGKTGAKEKRGNEGAF